MSENVVEMIREKTEEVDLEQILKTSMGGYTKKSVLEYLSQLKRQQQNAAGAFNQTLQATLDEKEKLQKENESLRNRLLKAETDCRLLQNRAASEKVEGTNLREQDVTDLKSNLVSLEKDMDEALVRIRANEQELEHRQYLLDEKEKELQRALQGSKMYQELLATAKGEAGELNKTISALTTDVSQLQGEVKFLKGVVSDGKVAELNDQITKLMADVEQQQAEIQVKNQKLEQREKQLALLTQQEEANHRLTEQLQGSLDETAVRNEKLEAANRELSERICALMEQSVAMLRAQSDLRVERAVLQRKLDSERLHTLVDRTVPDKAEEAAAPETAEKPAAKK